MAVRAVDGPRKGGAVVGWLSLAYGLGISLLIYMVDRIPPGLREMAKFEAQGQAVLVHLPLTLPLVALPVVLMFVAPLSKHRAALSQAIIYPALAVGYPLAIWGAAVLGQPQGLDPAPVLLILLLAVFLMAGLGLVVFILVARRRKNRAVLPGESDRLVLRTPAGARPGRVDELHVSGATVQVLRRHMLSLPSAHDLPKAVVRIPRHGKDILVGGGSQQVLHLVEQDEQELRSALSGMNLWFGGKRVLVGPWNASLGRARTEQIIKVATKFQARVDETARERGLEPAVH